MDGEASFVLGVDLDGVCGDFYLALRPIVAEWLGANEEDLSLTDFRFGLRGWGVKDLDHYKRIHRFAVTQRGLFADMPPIQGAAPALRRLSDDGIHIRIITHRLFLAHFHQEAVRQTVEWLDRYGFPYWDLCFVKEKVEVGADLYVEDSPDNIEKLASLGKSVIVFTNPTNAGEFKELPRAFTWDDVEALTRREVVERGKTLAPPAAPEGPANDVASIV